MLTVEQEIDSLNKKLIALKLRDDTVTFLLNQRMRLVPDNATMYKKQLKKHSKSIEKEKKEIQSQLTRLKK